MSSDRELWHFGLLPYTGTGHLNPLIALGRELTRRGHRVTVFEKPKIADRVCQANLEFVSVPGDWSAQRVMASARQWNLWPEIAMLRFNVHRVIRDIESYLSELPAVITRSGVNALLVNEIALTGPTLAEQLHLPYILISTSLPHSFGWRAYPWFTGYRYVRSPVHLLEMALLDVSALRIRGPIRRAVDRHRKSVNLQPVRGLQRMYPPLAHITQFPKYLDGSRARLSPSFHYTGPFISREARMPVEFPYHRLDDRPLIYASLGTTRSIQPRVFRVIAEACASLDVQLVLSLGGRLNSADFAGLPGKPLIARFTPQLELLERAALVITHCGANSVLEALMEGKPVVAIPLAYDQPAIAARLAHEGIGIVLPIMRLSSARVRAAITSVLHDPSYRCAAVRIQQNIRHLRGTEQAAQIIEESLSSNIAPRSSNVVPAVSSHAGQ